MVLAGMGRIRQGNTIGGNIVNIMTKDMADDGSFFPLYKTPSRIIQANL